MVVLIAFADLTVCTVTAFQHSWCFLCGQKDKRRKSAADFWIIWKVAFKGESVSVTFCSFERVVCVSCVVLMFNFKGILKQMYSHVCTYAHTHACMHVHACMCARAHTHTHTHTHPELTITWLRVFWPVFVPCNDWWFYKTLLTWT